MIDYQKINEVPYLYDRSGRIWLEGDRVLRIIEDEKHINNYKELLNSKNIDALFETGLVRTKILEDIPSRNILILEHKKIPFILHPCEYSNKMFWQAACMFIEVNQKLWQEGFVTYDSHPWNVSFDGTKPVFYDFGSLKKRENLSKGWFDEFFTRFMIPIWLSSHKKTYEFSKEYRREHANGFGVSLFRSEKLKKIFFRKAINISRFRNDPSKLFQELLKWLHKNQPISIQPAYWSDYYNDNNVDFSNLTTTKQKFVLKILSDISPKNVVDLASNKGYYSNMAAHFGAEVVAFDYEEEIINHLLLNNSSINRITPAHMDFNNPTPPQGSGLFWESSFKRFESDIVLALGLIHHICITQNIPVYLFCETCKKYAKKGILMEFVDPNDKHVLSWNKKPPKDYSLKKIQLFMKNKFPNCIKSDIDLSEGINRTYLYFYK